MPIIQIGGYYDMGVEPEDEAAAVREAGYTGMKFKVGRLSPKEDAARIHAARRGGGDDFVLVV